MQRVLIIAAAISGFASPVLAELRCARGCLQPTGIAGSVEAKLTKPHARLLLSLTSPTGRPCVVRKRFPGAGRDTVCQGLPGADPFKQSCDLVTASTALANSTNAPSPMSLTIRPEWAAIAGSASFGAGAAPSAMRKLRATGLMARSAAATKLAASMLGCVFTCPASSSRISSGTV